MHEDNLKAGFDAQKAIAISEGMSITRTRSGDVFVCVYVAGADFSFHI